MMRNSWYFILFFLIGLTSCKSFENVSIPTVEKISKFRPGEWKDGKLTFSFTTQINNPDKLKFKIRKVDLDVLLNGNKIAEIHTDRVIRIRKLLKPEVDWELTGDLKALIKPGMILSLLSGGKPEFSVKGTMQVSKFLVRKTIPVDLKTLVKLPF